AGLTYRDDEGRVADFHALRHSYITLLSRCGVNPKLAQELARHSDIRLTMNVYTHAALYDLAGAVESLPTLLSDKTASDALAATGTEGNHPPESGQREAAPRAIDRALTNPMRLPAVRVRTNESASTAAQAFGTCRNSIETLRLAGGCEAVKSGERKLPGQD